MHAFATSFELYDPQRVDTSHRFQDSHARKAEHEHYASHIAETVHDLIHMGVVQEGEDYSEMTMDELVKTVSTQVYYLPKAFDHTHDLLAQIQ